MSRKQRKEISLFQLDQTHPSLPLLQAQVAENSSVLPVFIHPFYETYSDSPTPRAGKRRILQQLRLLQAGAVPPKRETIDSGETVLSELAFLLRLWRFLQKNQTKVVGLGECVPYVAATIDLFRRFGYKGDILHYPTRLSGPQPADGEGDWQGLSTAIALLKPTTIAVGGQLSLLNPEDGGCVPTFIRSVGEGLDKKKTRLVASPIVFPFWRNSSMIVKR